MREHALVTAQRFEPHLDALLMTLTSDQTTTVLNLRSIPVDDLLDGAPVEDHARTLRTSLHPHPTPHRARTDPVSHFVPARDTLGKYVRGRAVTPPTESGGAPGRPSRATAEKGHAVYERWVSTVRSRVLGDGGP